MTPPVLLPVFEGCPAKMPREQECGEFSSETISFARKKVWFYC